MPRQARWWWWDTWSHVSRFSEAYGRMEWGGKRFPWTVVVPGSHTFFGTTHTHVCQTLNSSGCALKLTCAIWPCACLWYNYIWCLGYHTGVSWRWEPSSWSSHELHLGSRERPRSLPSWAQSNNTNLLLLYCALHTMFGSMHSWWERLWEHEHAFRHSLSKRVQRVYHQRRERVHV